MRGRVPAGALVTGGRDVFASTADSEVWVIRGDSPVAQRASAYARRVFRDAHPLDDLAGTVDNAKASGSCSARSASRGRPVTASRCSRRLGSSTR